jgi:transcriptional regulator with XRE-family HTH domain
MGLSQQAFADAVGVSFATINRWEKRQSRFFSARVSRFGEIGVVIVTAFFNAGGTRAQNRFFLCQMERQHLLNVLVST